MQERPISNSGRPVLHIRSALYSLALILAAQACDSEQSDTSGAGTGGVSDSTSGGTSASGTSTGPGPGPGPMGSDGADDANDADDGGPVGDGADGNNTTTADPTNGDSMGDSTSGGDGGTTAGTNPPEVDLLPANMIDDFEDGNGAIIEQEGRIGSWYIYNDESAGGTQMPTNPFTPAVGGADQSLFSGQTVGGGFETWGAGIGVDLNNPGDPDGGLSLPLEYDASAFEGFAFYARGNVSLQVKLATSATVPVEQGGTCGPDDLCSDAHATTVMLTDTWTQHVIAFSDLMQGGFGTPADFDPATVLSVQFQIPVNTDFDIYVDDVGFF